MRSRWASHSELLALCYYLAAQIVGSHGRSQLAA
jgi:hypothetical protein